MPGMECKGEHRFYVADVAVVQAEGKVVVVSQCTACGEVRSSEVQVTKVPGASIVSTRNEKEKENN